MADDTTDDSKTKVTPGSDDPTVVARRDPAGNEESLWGGDATDAELGATAAAGGQPGEAGESSAGESPADDAALGESAEREVAEAAEALNTANADEEPADDRAAQLRAKADEVRERATEKAADVREAAGEKTSDLKDKASELRGKAGEKTSDAGAKAGAKAAAFAALARERAANADVKEFAANTTSLIDTARPFFLAAFAVVFTVLGFVEGDSGTSEFFVGGAILFVLAAGFSDELSNILPRRRPEDE